MGTHKSVGGEETLGVGGLNLPSKKDKHGANLYSQRVQQANRAGRRLARAAARLARER